MIRRLVVIFIILFSGYVHAQDKAWDVGLISPYEYDQADYFSDGMAAVRKGNKWGFVNEYGKLTIAPKYSEVEWFVSGICAVKFEGLWYFIDKKGNQFDTPGYDKVNCFDPPLLKVKKDGKWGAYSFDINMLFEPQHHYFAGLPESLIKVEKKTAYMELFSPHVCVMNYEGDTIIPMDFYSIKYTGGYLLCAKEVAPGNYAKAFFNLKGQQLTGFDYQEMAFEEFGADGTIVMTRISDDASVLLDQKLQLIKVLPYGVHGQVIIQPNGVSTYGIYDTEKGEWVLDHIYDKLEYLIDNKTLIYEKGEDKGIITITGEVLLQTDFDDARFAASENDVYRDIIITKDDKLGFLDTETGFFSGIVYPIGNNSDINFSEKDAIILLRETESTWMLIDRSGKKIRMGLITNEYPIFNEQKIAVRGPNGKWGFLSISASN